MKLNSCSRIRLLLYKSVHRNHERNNKENLQRFLEEEKNGFIAKKTLAFSI